MARKQKEIPGTERESDEEIDAAAADVYEFTADRLRIQEQEGLARNKLLDLMKRKNVTDYLYVDGEQRFTVARRGSERVSVKKAKAATGPVEE